jgi:hypothetical protein
MMDNEISHDQITRFLSKEEFDSRHLWLGLARMRLCAGIMTIAKVEPLGVSISLTVFTTAVLLVRQIFTNKDGKLKSFINR